MLALEGEAAGRQPLQDGQPFLQFVVEPVLGLAELQVEKAEDERAGEAQHRGAEGGAHAGKRRLQPALQVAEHLPEVAALEDRKSVVQGKSVSVRVDLGGRRIIKKKKKKHSNNHKQPKDINKP